MNIKFLLSFIIILRLETVMYTLILDETLKELTIQGSEAFPFALYHSGVTMFDKGYLDWHWHDQYEINLVISGTLHYFVENKSYLLHPGEAVFINAGRLHRGYSEDSEQISNTIVFSADILCPDSSSEWYQILIDDWIHSDVHGIILRPDLSWMNAILQEINRIFQEERKKDLGYQFMQKASICRIFTELIRNMPYATRPTGAESERQRRLRRILTYITKHYMENVTLKSLSRTAQISEAECSRFFHDMMGMTPFEYLNQYRIEKSCEMLPDSEKSIGEIALECGFNSFSYFSKRFKEIMYMTPKEYRKKIRSARESV